VKILIKSHNVQEHVNIYKQICMIFILQLVLAGYVNDRSKF